MRPPTQNEIIDILRRHDLVAFAETPKRAFLVGSFACGTPNADSDVDILVEIEPRDGWTPAELEERYRHPIRQYFVTHDIRGKADHVHPQWEGRRVDLYLTYDADSEPRPKQLLEVGPEIAASRRKRAPR